jgi:hypothetical protein
MKNRELSEKQERLLMCYHDAACSWFGGVRARRLLGNSESARQYVESLQAISSAMKSPSSSSATSVELWQGVARRIEQEERAALYLGKRTFVDKGRSANQGRVFNGFWVGVPVVAASALALALVWLPGSETSPLGGTETFTGTAPRLQTAQNEQVLPASQQNLVLPVSAQGSVEQRPSEMALAQNTPLPSYARSQDPWEVEWIRSDGRVRMIQHRAGRAPILWINRQGSMGRLPTQEVHRLKDGSELRILDNPVPQAITVSNE